jgi:hypothetical protein
MPSVTVQISMAGPTDNAGTCDVLYQVVNAVDIVPEIFVVKQYPLAYEGAEPILIWQHVAYADELTNLLTTIEKKNTAQMIRKSNVNVRYPSVEAAGIAIDSIKSQIQRLVNELNTLGLYSEPVTYTITSNN